MLDLLRDFVANFSGDVRRGLDAPTQHLMTGKLAALAFSVPVIVLLAVATPLGLLWALMVGVLVQLVLGWAIAGRAMRRNGG
ncbi:hypothetical protein [Alkalilacustris brevis]|uniref:hypothetical protein n=1 Tax=Alkalilacustris brevis TaxID=2026338 RepID=UPI000E0E07A1|nr:hypothetical protein [Alkalilacustris brevis]